MKTKIIIIGVGNIGRRHLQAVSKLTSIESILCFDIHKAPVNYIPSFCRENNIRTDIFRIMSDYDEVLTNISRCDIVIIATTAKGRFTILKDVINRHPLAILSEKPLCQNLQEYKSVLRLSKKENIPIYINFLRHRFDFYERIEKILRHSKIKCFNAFFWGGMACTGIHIIELMTWLLHAKTYKIIHSAKERVYRTKRKGYFDFSGEMSLILDNLHFCFLKAEAQKSIFSIEISSAMQEFKIYEFSQSMTTVNRLGNVKIERIKPLNVSETTDKVVLDILKGRNVKLPDAASSYLAHRILFDYMKRNRLADINIT